MQLFVLRPTFEIPLADDREQVIAKLGEAYKRIGAKDSFFMHGEYGELHLPASEHRLWSPHLSFYLFMKNHHCTLCGRFAPRVEVWTFVWIIYLAMSCITFFGLVLGYSQWVVGETTWGFWAAAVALLTIVVLNIVAHVGQQWSADQMHSLRDRLDRILTSSEIHPAR